MQALKRRFKRSAEDEADDPDADIQRGMWKNHKLLPPALPAKVRYWDPLLLICSLYFFVTLPLILCFGLQPSIGWLVRARRRPSSSLPFLPTTKNHPSVPRSSTTCSTRSSGSTSS